MTRDWRNGGARSYQSEVGFNTTTSTLGSSETFTGVLEQNDMPEVGVSCYSDTAGTLYFDFCVDDDTSNIRTFPTSGFSVSAGVHEFHTAVKLSRFFRVRFVNGSSAQSTFQLYTYYGENFRLPSAPRNQPLSLDADAILTRPSFPWLDTARGLSTGIIVVEKFCHSDAIGTSWTPVSGAEIYQTPTSAVSLEIVSSSSDDALNGSGAHEITVEGLDANWELQTVSKATNATDGTTAENLTGTWLRVFRAYVSKSGAYATSGADSHTGTITVRVQGGGSTYAEISLINSFGVGQTLLGGYTIPAGYTGYFFRKTLTVASGKTANVGFFVRDNADDISSSYDGALRIKSLVTGLTGGAPFAPNTGNVPIGPFTGPADIIVMAYGASTPEVAVEFEIFLVQE